MWNSSIRPIDRTLSGATTPDQSGPGSEGNEGVLRIPQSSSITGASASDGLVSYPGHLLVESFLRRDTVGVFYSPSRLGHCLMELPFPLALFYLHHTGDSLSVVLCIYSLNSWKYYQIYSMEFSRIQLVLYKKKKKKRKKKPSILTVFLWINIIGWKIPTEK